MIETKPIFEVTPKLETFIEECDKLGYKNNNSLNALRFNWVLEEGLWLETSVDGKMVGISGVHEFKDGVRALYRGAQLYSIPGGLTKNHMNCWMFYYHLPIVIKMYGDRPIYVTTNIDNDASGKMLKLNRLYDILAKKGFYDLVSTEEIFGVQQRVWKLNPDIYWKYRNAS